MDNQSIGQIIYSHFLRNPKNLFFKRRLTQLEKALNMLPAIDPEKLKPSADSLKQLKADILRDAQVEERLRTKVRSLEYDDRFSFWELLKDS